jgi:hypothetical protein
LAHGPDEKYGRAGRSFGFINVSPYRERAPRWDGVARHRCGVKTMAPQPIISHVQQ